MWETPTVILADTHFDLGYIFLRLRVILINLPSNFTARLTYTSQLITLRVHVFVV